MTILNKLNVTYGAVMPDGRKFSGNCESNAAVTEILSRSVDTAISADKTAVRAGESFRVTVTVTNNSTAKLFDNFFSASQPDGAIFAEGSAAINGVPDASYNPASGFPLPDLNPGESVVIEYVMKAVRPAAATQYANIDYNVYDPVRGNAGYSAAADVISVNIFPGKDAAANNGYAVKIRYRIVCLCPCCNCCTVYYY